MFGGIPHSEIDELQKYWNTFPSLCEELFIADADKPYSQLKTEDTQSVIEQNSDVKAFQKRFARAFEGFADSVHHRLIDQIATANPQKELDAISDDILPVYMKHLLLTDMRPIKRWLTTGRALPTTLRPYSKKALKR